MFAGLVEVEVWVIMFVASAGVVLILLHMGESSVETAVLLDAGDACVVISTEEVVMFIRIAGSAEIIVFPDSVEVVVSLVVIGSAEVPAVKWGTGSTEELIFTGSIEVGMAAEAD